MAEILIAWGASHFCKNTWRFQSPLDKQSLPPQAGIESAQADLVCIAPDFQSVGICKFGMLPF